MNGNRLVGYVRRSLASGALKVSVNVEALNECDTYETSDGQKYVPLVISLASIRKVIDGERGVTVVSQVVDE